MWETEEGRPDGEVSVSPKYGRDAAHLQMWFCLQYCRHQGELQQQRGRASTAPRDQDPRHFSVTNRLIQLWIQVATMCPK